MVDQKVDDLAHLAECVGVVFGVSDTSVFPLPVGAYILGRNVRLAGMAALELSVTVFAVPSDLIAHWTEGLKSQYLLYLIDSGHSMRSK